MASGSLSLIRGNAGLPLAIRRGEGGGVSARHWKKEESFCRKKVCLFHGLALLAPSIAGERMLGDEALEEVAVSTEGKRGGKMKRGRRSFVSWH